MQHQKPQWRSCKILALAAWMLILLALFVIVLATISGSPVAARLGTSFGRYACNHYQAKSHPREVIIAATARYPEIHALQLTNQQLHSGCYGSAIASNTIRYQTSKKLSSPALVFFDKTGQNLEGIPELTIR